MFASLDEPLIDDVDDPQFDDPDFEDPGDEAVPAIDLSLEPGARLALQVQCAAAVPELLSRTEVLDTVEGVGIVQRWLAGVRIRMLAEFTDRHPADTATAPPGADESGMVPSQRWVPAEVGLTEGISRLEALGEIAQAQRFTQVLPDTLALLERGRIDLRRAEAIARATAVLPDDKARAVEAAVLAKAPDATLRQLRDRVRRAIARVDPDGEYRRHRQANTERRVSIRSLEDGMASLWFYGSAAEIEAAWQMADRLARSVDADDPRTLEQRRFDLAMQALQGRLTVTDTSDVDTAVGEILGEQRDLSEQTPENPTDCAGSGVDDRVESGADEDTASGLASDGADRERSGPTALDDDRPPPAYRIPPDVLADAVAEALSRRPDLHATVRKPLVQVVVGLDTLLGSQRPAELVGHGPIDADTARALAADATIRRLMTDPLDGSLLEHGRTTYTPPAALADHVRSRDQICRGPRCTRRIRDLDHHQEWGRGGDTDDENLYGYCKHCHLLKDAPGWHVVAHPDGTVTWISPCGRRTTSEPFDYRDFTDDLPGWTEFTPAAVDSHPGSGTDPGRGGVVDADDPPPF